MTNQILKKLSTPVFFAIITVALVSCTMEKEKAGATVDDRHTSQNSLSITGTYTGVLPCASCEGLKTEIVLTDSTYKLSMIYLGENDPDPAEKNGSYSWNEAGNIITLKNMEPPNKYFVGENVLIHLNQDGERVTGNLAERYRLQKLP